MNRFHFLLSIAVSVAVYVCIGVLWGREGIWAYNQLQKQKIIMSIAAEHLQDINSRLQAERTALQKDADVIASYAKKLGYVSSGERLVKITGLEEKPLTVYDPGTKVSRTEIIFIPEWLAKGIGLAVFFFYNFIASVLLLVRRHGFTKVGSEQY
ncbi:septum formation initiator family protein [Treponema sp. HNW]|uniref:FtsB family cell division protein n=1 Tax=Treponema sp. HNW TaxID=3116654 RepID=UPI003D122D41